MYRLVAGIALLHIFGLNISLAQDRETDRAEVRHMREAELAQAKTIVAVAPLQNLEGWEAELVVVNRSWKVVDIEVDAVHDDGRTEELTRVSVSSRLHKTLPLLQMHQVPKSGALRIRYNALPNALQAHLVYTRRSAVGNVFSIPFISAESFGPQYLVWPVYQTSKAVEVTLINAGAAPSTLLIESGLDTQQVSLQPWQVKRRVLRAKTGSAIFRPRDQRSPVIVHAQQHRDMQPIHLPSMPLRGVDETSEITTVHVPTRDDGRVEDVWLTLGNPSKKNSTILVSLVSTKDGSVRASNGIFVEAARAKTVSLASLWNHIDDWRYARIVVGPQAGGVGAIGLVELTAAQATELSFAPLSIVHNSGSYPLYDFDGYRTVMHLLNLGSDAAEVGIELSWDDGRYALSPLTIEPDRALAVDLAEYVKRSPAVDVGGRARPRMIHNGFVKWLVINGSSELLARTEIQPHGSEDRFGINCETCCWEIPFGGIQPGDVTLTTPGSATTFETTLTFQTCTGQEGPFYFSSANLTYGAPYSWNSHSVSVSDGADATLSFSGTAQKTTGTTTCVVSNKPIDAGRRVDACKASLTSTHCPSNKCDPATTCDAQTSTCSGCGICCQRIKKYNECKRKSPTVVTSEFNACTGNCAITHCS